MTTIVVTGRGAAAWMAAAWFAHRGGGVTVVEDGPAAMTALATRSSFTDFNRAMGIEVVGTPRLGTLYSGWRRDYFHPLGSYGEDWDGVGFHHYWLRLQAGDPGRFSLETQAAKAGRFGEGLTHGHHVDVVQWIASVRCRFPDIEIAGHAQGDLHIDAREPEVTTWTEGPDAALYTTITKQPDGWSWRAPMGDYTLCGQTTARPTFTPWQGKTVTLPRLEPFGDLGLHLIQTAIERLGEVMPGPIRPSIVDRYNADMAETWNALSDFIGLRTGDISDRLKSRLDMFALAGHIPVPHHEIFTEADWFAHLSGLGYIPRAWHPIAGLASETDLRLRLARLRTRIDEQVAAL
ncbi:hypothetical protein ABAC460_18985 [Asticcacaulis sp. AC460]|uniref:tryptophan 7-halogenase n=1 Tax=Asticcacaulis sp. AC460 TaxID=1282360 RepID=UPI0003C3E07C|nr:tryptophan 7-halogenase [Asticcacaulis sp. AC460]ESQ87413.1 hypothetical protein ABAC460_18985 [Asticcacaulis sp. AC460]